MEAGSVQSRPRRGGSPAPPARRTGAPGSVTATCVPEPRAATVAANTRGGCTSRRRMRAPGPPGTAVSPASANVPQCTGTTTRGRSSVDGLGGAGGSRWPGPSVGPQPQTGSSATSSGAERGHAVEQVGVAGGVDARAARLEEVAHRAAACGPAVERGPQRWPLCAAGTPVRAAPPSTSSSPGASSSTRATPLAAQPRARRRAAPRCGRTAAGRRSEGRCRWSPCRWRDQHEVGVGPRRRVGRRARPGAAARPGR